ncbi:hypothetical protein MNB_SUP05-SYMBIONT-4-230 [hydrothermal vent metagenome]|uniref:Uncharacterized protein n=1 Tax=hydrothermal vent metagenome TaxID=652676 RepID=A0A1W1E6W4_9ZZZZ
MKHIKQHLFHQKIRQITDCFPYFWVENTLEACQSHWVNIVIA